MKDIIIKPKHIKRELFVYLGCLVFTYLLNVYAISKYDSNLEELYTMLGYVFVVSFVVYGLLAFLRIIFNLVKGLIKKK
jgi:TRAP-type C4-dicarboxylate transport system permease small subunit